MTWFLTAHVPRHHLLMNGDASMATDGRLIKLEGFFRLHGCIQLSFELPFANMIDICLSDICSAFE